MWSGGADSLGVPAWQEVVLKEESYNLELVVWRASSQSRWTGYPTLRRGVISLAPCCSCSSSGGTWLAARLVCVPYILRVEWDGLAHPDTLRKRVQRAAYPTALLSDEEDDGSRLGG